MNNEELKKDLLIDEGLKLKPYLCSKGKLTIGIGRNIEDVGITKDEAFYLLENDIENVEFELDKNFSWWRNMSEKRQRALANMCFNLGIKRLLGFKKMLSAMEFGDFEKAAIEALNSDWAKQVGLRSTRIAQMIKQG
ncbi:MAG: glycoside hydrolase family protein [Alphaproteobacteria bacterium]